MSEWLDIMLAEIARKRAEDEAARDEHARRNADANEPGGDSKDGQGARSSGRAGTDSSK